MNQLIVERLSKAFGKKQALFDVSCQFSSGITALLGPNGAGKSTLMNIICTLLKPDSGAVYYNGQDVNQIKPEFLGNLSIQFQSQPMYRNDTAMEYLRFCGALKELPPKQVEEEGRKLLERFGLSDTGKKKIAAFSGGMRQRLALCSTFLGAPKVILLDEPTAGLDIYEREALKRFLCELKKDRIIIVSTHIVSDVENIADEIILLNEGRIRADGTQPELISGLEGKVWELPADAAQPGSYYSDGKQMMIAGEAPCPGAVRKEPDLTDVYFSHVKGR